MLEWKKLPKEQNNNPISEKTISHTWVLLLFGVPGIIVSFPPGDTDASWGMGPFDGGTFMNQKQFFGWKYFPTTPSGGPARGFPARGEAPSGGCGGRELQSHGPAWQALGKWSRQLLGGYPSALIPPPGARLTGPGPRRQPTSEPQLVALPRRDRTQDKITRKKKHTMESVRSAAGSVAAAREAFRTTSWEG